jgi:hypothetical protein
MKVLVLGVFVAAATIAWWPVPQQHGNGAVTLRLTEEQMMYSVAVIGPDGKPRIEDVQGKTNAEARIRSLKGGLDVR